MYYILMLTATIIFASIAWVANYSIENGWSIFFLASISYAIALIIFSVLCKIRKKAFFDISMWKDAIKPAIILLFGNVSINVAVFYTTPDKIGFLVGLTVIILPFLQFVLYKTKIPNLMYLSVILILLGNFTLNYSKETNMFSFGIGEILSIAAATCYALSIIWIGRCAKEFSFESFGFIQSLVSSFGYFILSIITGTDFSIKGLPILPVVFYGICSYVVANAFQFIAQKRLLPIVAAIIISLQPILGIFIGSIFFRYYIGANVIISGILFFAASVIGILAGSKYLLLCKILGCDKARIK